MDSAISINIGLSGQPIWISCKAMLMYSWIIIPIDYLCIHSGEIDVDACISLHRSREVDVDSGPNPLRLVSLSIFYNPYYGANSATTKSLFVIDCCYSPLASEFAPIFSRVRPSLDPARWLIWQSSFFLCKEQSISEYCFIEAQTLVSVLLQLPAMNILYFP